MNTSFQAENNMDKNDKMSLLEAELLKLFGNLNKEQRIEFINVIVHIIRRLIEFPTVPKFRTLRKDNEAFKKKILELEGATDVLKQIGFQEESTRWYFPPTSDHLLKTCLTEIEGARINVDHNISANILNPDKPKHTYEPCLKQYSKEIVNPTQPINSNTRSNINNNSNQQAPSSGLQLGGMSKRRLEKEKLEILNEGEEIVKLIKELPDSWILQIKGADDTLYSNETFNIQFKFTDRYPIESPEVVFVGVPPVHPHIYSNGHICLSILYDHWSPVLSVNAVCLSIISMLSSCKKKRKPIDDLFYCSAGSKTSPKNMRWMFHDDTI